MSNPAITSLMNQASAEGIVFEDYVLYLIYDILSSGPGNNAFVQNGNAFGETAILGTTDNENLSIITNGTEKIVVTTSGFTGINKTIPLGMLSVRGDSDSSGDYALIVESESLTPILKGNNDGWVGVRIAAPTVNEVFHVGGYAIIDGRLDIGSSFYFNGSGFSGINSSFNDFSANFAGGYSFMNGATNYTQTQLDGFGGNRVNILSELLVSKEAGATDTDRWVQIGTDAYLVFGDVEVDGAWRQIESGGDFLIQKLEAGLWVTKQTIAG